MTYLSEVKKNLLPLLPSATLLRKDYVFTGVCLSVHRGECVSQHALEQIPPGQTYPSMHWGRHPPWADISQHALGQIPPLGRHIPACTGADTPWADISQHALGQIPPLGRHIPACTGADTPRWVLQRTVRILLECILVYWCIPLTHTITSFLQNN